MHDLSDSSKILDIAIGIAASEGVVLPDKNILKEKSFLGTVNFFIIDSDGKQCHKIKIVKIKNYLNAQTSIADADQAVKNEKPWVKATCSTCKFWDSNGITGLCRRFPKQASSEWATTHILDWCGEHEGD